MPQRDLAEAVAQENADIDRARHYAGAIHWLLGRLWTRLAKAGLLAAPPPGQAHAPGQPHPALAGQAGAKAKQDIERYLTLLDQEYGKMDGFIQALQGTSRKHVSALLAPLGLGIEEVERAAAVHGLRAGSSQ